MKLAPRQILDLMVVLMIFSNKVIKTNIILNNPEVIMSAELLVASESVMQEKMVQKVKLKKQVVANESNYEIQIYIKSNITTILYT